MKKDNSRLFAPSDAYMPAYDTKNVPPVVRAGERNRFVGPIKRLGLSFSNALHTKQNLVPNVVGKIALFALAIGFFFVLFQAKFDFEVIFKRVIGTNFALFDLNTFISSARSILPDGVGIFDTIENLFVLVGCLAYTVGFLINLIFAIFFF